MRNFLFGEILLLAISSCISKQQKQSAACIETQKRATKEIASYNFSTVWKSTDEPYIGFIGPDFQRLHIHFSSINKRAGTPEYYDVQGASMVKGIVRELAGVIHVRRIRQIPDSLTHLTRYELSADYEFRESSLTTIYGVFRGKLTSQVYSDGKRIYSDDLDSYAERWCTNQFEGTWTSFRTGQKKKANWGIRRIPDSGKLDIGSGEFSPDSQYWANGWQSYVDACSGKPQAVSEEDRSWWEGTQTKRVTWKEEKADHEQIKIALYINGQYLQTLICRLDMAPDFRDSTFAVCLKDVTFDGNKEVLVSLGNYGNQGVEFYDCFTWNPAVGKYIAIPSFRQIGNASVSLNHHCIYSKERASASEYIQEKYIFHERKFIKTGALYTKFTGDTHTTYTETLFQNGRETVTRRYRNPIQASADWAWVIME